MRNSLANQSYFPPDEANLIFRFRAVSAKSADAIGAETCAYFIYSLADPLPPEQQEEGEEEESQSRNHFRSKVMRARFSNVRWSIAAPRGPRSRARLAFDSELRHQEEWGQYESRGAGSR